MEILQMALIALAIALLPRLMVLLSERFRPLQLLGPVFLCYAAGLGLSFFITESAFAMSLAEVLVPVAIPLILFSANLSAVRRLARPTLVSFALVAVSVFLSSAGAFFLFREKLPDAAALSGMCIGLYTGGTPNLIAIGVALGVPDETIVLANTMDVVVGGLYFLLLLSAMPRLVRALLPKPSAESAGGGDGEDAGTRDFLPTHLPFRPGSLLRLLPAVGLAVASLAAAAGLALLITGGLDVMVIMLTVTTLGIVLSFVKKVRAIPHTFAAGQYVIYMFSVAIGMSFDFSALVSGVGTLLLFFLLVQFGAVALHLLLARIFGIDGDTCLITSTAGIYGPAFVVPVAGALGNRAVILPGLVCGILGYAVGNYLGIAVAALLGLL